MGNNVEFACGTCATADFSNSFPSIGGLGGPSLCGYPAGIPKRIIENDDQLCAKSVLSGAKFDIDLLSFLATSGECVDADFGASCAAAGGHTSYNRGMDAIRGQVLIFLSDIKPYGTCRESG